MLTVALIVGSVVCVIAVVVLLSISLEGAMRSAADRKFKP